MKNIDTTLKVFLAFYIGICISSLVWHFRFSNPLLRKEMLLFMQEGNGYFLDWFFIQAFFLILFWIAIAIYYAVRNRKKAGKKR